MEAKLKAKLTDAVEAFLAGDGAQVTLSPDPRDGSPDLYAFLHKRMRSAKLWRTVEEALVRERLDQILAHEDAKRRRTVDERQLPLFEGFAVEYLPRRIRAGKAALPLDQATVQQFLTYKDRYEVRAAKDQRVVDELRRLASRVQRFASEDGLTMAQALDRQMYLVEAEHA